MPVGLPAWDAAIPLTAPPPDPLAPEPETPVATWTPRTTIVTRHEWVVPAAEPWGACWVEVFRAFHNAEHEYRRLHGLPTEAPDGGRLRDLADDAIRMHVGDDEIVLRFETETTE